MSITPSWLERRRTQTREAQLSLTPLQSGILTVMEEILADPQCPVALKQLATAFRPTFIGKIQAHSDAQIVDVLVKIRDKVDRLIDAGCESTNRH